MNLYFLFGEDSYRLQKRLRELREGVGAGEFNVSQIDAQENWDINRFENELTAIGFFGGQRLVIVKNLLAAKDVDGEKVTGLLAPLCHPELPSGPRLDPAETGDSGSRNPRFRITCPQRLSVSDGRRESGMTDKQKGISRNDNGVTVIVVESGKPDKRTKLYKWLNKNAQAEEFIKLTGSDWQKFALGLITASKINISPPARQTLITETEGESWQLVNIVNQLELWTGSICGPDASIGVYDRALGVDDVSLFTRRKLRGNSFQLLDALARGRQDAVLRHLEDLWAQGEAPLRVLGAIVYQYRQLIHIKAALDEGIDTYQIVRELKIPPFVVQKIVPMARNMDWNRLKKIYSNIAQIDEYLKSGRIEPVSGIEILIYNLLKLHRDQGGLVVVK